MSRKFLLKWRSVRGEVIATYARGFFGDQWVATVVQTRMMTQPYGIWLRTPNARQPNDNIARVHTLDEARSIAEDEFFRRMLERLP